MNPDAGTGSGREHAGRVMLATVNHHGQLVGRVVDEGRRDPSSPLSVGLRDYLLANDLNHNEIRPHDPADAAHPWFSGYGGVVLDQDLSAATRTAAPFAERLAFADASDSAGVPIAVAPRAVVKHLVRTLDNLGLRALVATELEFYLLPGDCAEYGEAELQRHFQTIAGGDGLVDLPQGDQAVIEELADACAGADIEVEGYSQETGYRQYELNFAPADPLAACDSHVLFKHLARAVARRHGCVATFMAKPAAGAIGSSCRVNFSLVDASGHVDLAAPARGLLRELPALALLLLPYANSYRRLRPGGSLARLSLSTDRSSAVRLTEGRAEVRVAGADANPYLAVSAVLSAAISGLKSHSGDDGDDPVGTMPLSIESAIAAAHSTPAWDVLPDGLREHVTELAALECEVDRRQVTSFDRVRLLTRI